MSCRIMRCFCALRANLSNVRNPRTLICISYCLYLTGYISFKLSLSYCCLCHKKDSPLRCYTVQTVAADLRQGEHIPKMQNDIGHKSKLRMLRQRGGKEAGGGAGCRAVPCRDVTCRAGPRRAALGLTLRSAKLP